MPDIKRVASKIQKKSSRTPEDDARDMQDVLAFIDEIEKDLSTSIYILSKVRNTESSEGSARWSKMLSALSGVAPVLFDSLDVIEKRLASTEG